VPTAIAGAYANRLFSSGLSIAGTLSDADTISRAVPSIVRRSRRRRSDYADRHERQSDFHQYRGRARAAGELEDPTSR